jgi:hypothetical protein
MHKNRPTQATGSAVRAMSGVVLCLAVAPAVAQDAGKPATGTVASEPNPYYVGVAQAFTHDSNVYRIPSGPSDVYSSTSLFGGFDQLISRQRVYGRGNVSLNRYSDQTQLNNTSYDLSAGADLQTIESISGNLNAGFSQSLVAPAAFVSTPAPGNQQQVDRIGATLRWGGPSLLTLEGTAGYVRVDYSAPAYVTSQTRETTTSIGLFYRPGALLRVGVAARLDRIQTPQAFLDPVTGTYLANDADSRNLDFLADYAYGGSLSGNMRLSYTEHTNSQIANGDFSGFTGSLVMAWQATAKTSVQFDISRDDGFDTASATRYAVVQGGTGVFLTPVPFSYYNNRLTSTVGLGATYSATSKIGLNARLRYLRSHVVSPQAPSGITTDYLDEFKGASIGMTYAITRAWGASCNLGYERRDVSGSTAYDYNANTISCATQFTWR